MHSILELVSSVRKSLEIENWIASVLVVLTIPDICGKIEFPDDNSSSRYIKWFENNVADKYNYMAQDIYALRCSMLHEGSDSIIGQRKRKEYDDFTFQPNSTNTGVIVVDNCNSGGTHAIINLVDFCNSILAAVEIWNTSRNVHLDFKIPEDSYTVDGVTSVGKFFEQNV